MKSLSKNRLMTLAALQERWDNARAELEEAELKANVEIEQAVTAFNAKIATLNAIIEDANAFREEVESDIQDVFDERSEKWQEGDRGQAFAAWLASWQNEIEAIEEAEVEKIDIVSDVPEELITEDDYPTEPSE